MREKLFRSIRNRIGMFTFIATILLIVTGCGESMESRYNNLKKWNKDIRDQMVEYMSDKYGEPFKLYDNEYSPTMSPGYSFDEQVCPESNCDVPVYVMYQEVDGETVFRDNYPKHLLNDQIAPYYEETVRGVYQSDYALFASPPGNAVLPAGYGAELTVENLLWVNGTYLWLFVWSSPDNRDELASDLWKAMKDTRYGYNFTISIIYLDPSLVNGISTREEYNALPTLFEARIYNLNGTAVGEEIGSLMWH